MRRVSRSSPRRLSSVLTRSCAAATAAASSSSAARSSTVFLPLNSTVYTGILQKGHCTEQFAAGAFTCRKHSVQMTDLQHREWFSDG